MARKSKAEDNTEIEDTSLQEVDQEKELNYADDVNENVVLPKEERKVEEDIKEQETVEEIKEEQPKKTPEPAIDTEKLKAEIAEETTNKIVEALKGKTETETEQNVNALEKFRDDFEKKNGRDPNWVELGEYIGETSYQRLKAEIRSEEQAKLDTEQARLAQERSAGEKFAKEVDEELSELYRNNKLPKIKNVDDPTDIGVQAFNELQNTMIRVNNDRVSKGLEPIRSISRIHANYYKAPTRQPAGGNIDTSNSRSVQSQGDEEEINYMRDIKGKSWTSFFKR